MVYAMFTMILLTFAIAIYLFVLRVNAIKKGQVKISQFRLNNNADVPDRLVQAARNYSNLFEVPLLFYIAGVLALALHLETITLVILSWMFVISRLIHSWIHLTSNNVLHRLKAFMFGNICVLLMWTILIWQYATGV